MELAHFAIGTACYKTGKARTPQSAGESAGKSAGKKGTAGRTAGTSAGRLLSLEKQRNGTTPSSPPSSPLFPGTLPSALLSPCGGFGLSQSCSRRSPLQGTLLKYVKAKKARGKNPQNMGQKARNRERINQPER